MIPDITLLKVWMIGRSTSACLVSINSKCFSLLRGDPAVHFEPISFCCLPCIFIRKPCCVDTVIKNGVITPPYTVNYKPRAIFLLGKSKENLMVKKIKASIDPVESQLRFEANFYGDWYSESVLAAYLSEPSADSPRSRRARAALHPTSNQKAADKK